MRRKIRRWPRRSSPDLYSFSVNPIKWVWNVDLRVADTKAGRPFTASGDTVAAGLDGTAKFMCIQTRDNPL
jgi:hypothetical protein